MTVFSLLIWSCAAEKNTSEQTELSSPDESSPTETEIEDTEDNPSEPESGEPDDTDSGEPDDTDSSEPDDTDTNQPSDPLELIGTYTDNTGSEHVITSSHWTIDYGPLEPYSYYISQYNNDEQTVIAENAPQNGAPEAGAWSRFDWTVNSDGLWVCQTTNTATTEAEAMTTPSADVSDIADGCRPYGWLQLF